MGLLQPTPPPYDPLVWQRLPFPERARQVCQAWAIQGYGSPLAIYGAYGLKIGLYVLGWALICGASPALGGLAEIGQWWLHPIAFQKAILWSLLFEVLGLGCGSGPLTGRYVPPIGGSLYFLRPGTTKLPLFPRLPLLGGHRRTALDALLYAALLGCTTLALLAPAPQPAQIVPILALLVTLGLADRTIFLAARAEHYGATLLCMALVSDWIPGAKAVMLALWFWAGVSKLNAHFPTVVGVMTSNSPVTRWSWIRRLMYRSYPDDLRPSGLATLMAHAGTALELGVPLAFALSPAGAPPVFAVALMFLLHGFISSNVPMGVPLEWNVMMVYGGLALFWAHPDATLASLHSLPLVAALAVCLVAVPLLGNLYPRWISFLLAMRYYAGNWAWSVWLFRGDSVKKLDHLTKSSGWVHDQLGLLYDHRTSVGLVSKVMGFRLMHLHGRALAVLVPRAVDRLEDYEWADGEIIAGLALGWNFGEGHLHQEELLEAIQIQCGFEPGELRCVFVESQPLFGRTLAWRIHDAATGQISLGELPVAELSTRQPWEAPA